VKKNDGWAVGWARFRVSDIEEPSPASICFSGPNDVFVPGLIAGRTVGLAVPDCAPAEFIVTNGAVAMVRAATPRKPRR